MSSNAIVAASDLDNRPGAGMPVITSSTVPGYRVVAVKGLVRGNTIRTRHLGLDIMAAFKSMMGGEISEYTKMLAESREQALDRMRAECVARGGNAIVDARFMTSMVMQGAAEILVYGTAVVLEPESGDALAPR